MKGHASRIDNLEARVSSIESATSTVTARATSGDVTVWNDKYADNHRLRVDLELAHAEIRRLGGVIPEPCGPIVLRSVCGTKLEPVFAAAIVEVEYSGPKETATEDEAVLSAGGS